MKHFISICLVLIGFIYYGCSDQTTSTQVTDETARISFSLTNLPQPADTAKFVAWIVDLDPQSKNLVLIKNLGFVTPDANGNFSASYQQQLYTAYRAEYLLVSTEAPTFAEGSTVSSGKYFVGGIFWFNKADLNTMISVVNVRTNPSPKGVASITVNP